MQQQLALYERKLQHAHNCRLSRLSVFHTASIQLV
jgi:hypothetical protein